MFTPNKPDTTVIYSGESLKDAIDTMSSDMFHKAPTVETFISQAEHERLLLQALNTNVRLNQLYIILIDRAVDKIPFGKHTEEAITMLRKLQDAMRGID